MDALGNRMATLVERVRREIEAEAQRLALPAPSLRPHPPAPADRVAAFQNHVQLRLPPSYRAFLALHDGYEGLSQGGDLLPLADLLPGGAAVATVNAWKRQCAEYGSQEVLDGIVIASTTQPNHWLYIDPNGRPVGEEYPLVLWMGDTSEEFADLFDYLEFVIEVCRDDIDGEPSAD